MLKKACFFLFPTQLKAQMRPSARQGSASHALMAVLECQSPVTLLTLQHARNHLCPVLCVLHGLGLGTCSSQWTSFYELKLVKPCILAPPLKSSLSALPYGA